MTTAMVQKGCDEALSGEQILAKEFRDYVYGVSHDVGAPVRAMVEFSRLLTNEHAENLNEEGKLYLSLISQSGEKLQKMIGGLLDYSRLNTEAKPFAATSCTFVCENVRNILTDKIHTAGAVLEYGALREIHADARQIEQLFLALIDNAIKFQPPTNKPHIRITAEPWQSSWKFAVIDNGIGIEARYHTKIFQIFQRLHTESDYPGIGIGLTLAQKIVQRHGGKMWLDSVPRQGTIFFFTMPM